MSTPGDVGGRLVAPLQRGERDGLELLPATVLALAGNPPTIAGPIDFLGWTWAWLLFRYTVNPNLPEGQFGGVFFAPLWLSTGVGGDLYIDTHSCVTKCDEPPQLMADVRVSELVPGAVGVQPLTFAVQYDARGGGRLWFLGAQEANPDFAGTLEVQMWLGSQ